MDFWSALGRKKPASVTAAPGVPDWRLQTEALTAKASTQRLKTPTAHQTAGILQEALEPLAKWRLRDEFSA
jgi:hypothetical protein